MRLTSIEQLDALREKIQARESGYRHRVIVCHGPGCLANGAEQVGRAFEKELTARKIRGVPVTALKKTGCHGLCEKSPLVAIEPEGILYTRVKPKHVPEIIDRTVRGGDIIEELLYTNGDGGPPIAHYKDIPFYARQHRIALRNLGHISATEIEEYIGVGGYRALAKALTEMSPDEIIEEVSTSGLRGRGGGGFPTGRKWRTCADVPETPRYVICNGDEGDPGAFMDRAIMEGDPHSVLEGMIICARAVGSNHGYIYVREEYPLAVVHLQHAIDQARAYGLLGDDILGTGFSFDIRISRGAGAFVCGESSALMRSVAGGVGEPRAKYIRSVVKGLYDKPTVLNNVETFANIPVIVERGGKAFAAIGTPKNTGTKAFSLVGRVRNTGLIEVPMGTTLREIIYDIGGGMQDDRPFKAVQTGGPSGGCLPADKLDLPVDFDSLTAAGSMMGSGGMIVMDDRTCMVDVAKYFLSFLVSESCGKCTPCREGLYQLHKAAVRISEGMGKPEDLDNMERLSRNVVIGSLCGLGQSGPNPFLSTVRYFRPEYEAHIAERRCPAGVCRELITYEVIAEKCTGCMACIAACAVNAITGTKGEPHLINQEACDRCGACVAVCTYDAIKVY